MKAILIDVETTGTDPIKNGIVQISGLILINQAVVETFDYLVNPLPDDMVDEEAIKVHGLTIDHLSANGLLASEAKGEFDKLLGHYINKFDKTDKFLWYGYNALFDMDFIRQWYIKMGDSYFGSWFFFPPIDVMVIAAYYLRRERGQLANFRLTTVAKYLNIELDGEAHDALYDARLTLKVLQELERRIIERMKLDGLEQRLTSGT